MSKLLLQVQREDKATIRVYTRSKVSPLEISKMFVSEIVDTNRIFGPIEVIKGEEPAHDLKYYYIVKLNPNAQI